MAGWKKYDPIPRIEGHLAARVNLTLSNNIINAQMRGNMARGFETILEGRDMRDPMIICQRI